MYIIPEWIFYFIDNDLTEEATILSASNTDTDDRLAYVLYNDVVKPYSTNQQIQMLVIQQYIMLTKDALCLQTKEQELKPGGKDIQVTNENKRE